MPQFPKTDTIITSSEPFFFNQTFKDLEDLLVTTKEWDLDFMQLEQGRFQGSIMQAIASTWQFTHAQFGRSLKQQGLPPKHLRNLVIPGTASQDFQWRGHHITGNSVMIFPVGGELESITTNTFDVFIVAIAEDHLVQLCEQLGLEDLDQLTHGAEVVQCDLNAIERCRKQLQQIAQHLSQFPDAIHQKRFSHIVEFEICSQLLLALARGQMSNSEPRPRRQFRVLEKAEAYMRANAHENLTISQVCQYLKISDRTLRAAFQAHYGISPKAYLKGYQLTQVRRHLWQIPYCSTSIREIANHWGFWHMGQFAKDYKMMFGELPSDTLRKSKI